MYLLEISVVGINNIFLAHIIYLILIKQYFVYFILTRELKYFNELKTLFYKR